MSYQKQEMPKPQSLSDLKTIEGFYIGSEKIEFEQEGEKRFSLIHKFETDTFKGNDKKHHYPNLNYEVVEVWGFDMLDKLLSKIPGQVMTKVTYIGKGKKNKYGNEPHQCEVYFDVDIKRPKDRELPF